MQQERKGPPPPKRINSYPEEGVTYRLVEVVALRVNGNTQTRVRLNKEAIETYATLMKKDPYPAYRRVRG